MKPPPPPPQPLAVDKDSSSYGSGSDTRPSDNDDEESESARPQSKPYIKTASADEDSQESEKKPAAGGVDYEHLSNSPSMNRPDATASKSSKQPHHRGSVKMDERAAAVASQSHTLSKAERNAAHLARKRRNAARSREYKRQRMSDLKTQVEHFEQLVQRLLSEQAVLKAQIDVLKTTFQGSTARSLPLQSQTSNSNFAGGQATRSAGSVPQATAQSRMPSESQVNLAVPLNAVPLGWNLLHGSVHPPYTGYGITPQALSFALIQGSQRTSVPLGTPTTGGAANGELVLMQGNAAPQGTSAPVPPPSNTNIPTAAPDTQGVQDLVRLAFLAGLRPS